MREEEFTDLTESIRLNGYDPTFPIIAYQKGIIDGWHRYQACLELRIEPTIAEFTGTSQEAMELIHRSNTRRNLNTGQRAAMAADNAAMMEELKAQAAKRKLVGKADPVEIIPQGSACAPKSRELLAKAHGSNSRYVAQAQALKAEAPDVFEAVKSGKLTLQDGRKKASRRPVTAEWLPDELARKAAVEAGGSVVANATRDRHLIAWADREGKAVAIDRSSEWGNPFVLGKDGNRDAACSFFETQWMPIAGRFRKAAAALTGKVLVCHCYPERCHGEALIKLLR
jgi:ParB-like chromosome segregation protein Spo0J